MLFNIIVLAQLIITITTARIYLKAPIRTAVKAGVLIGLVLYFIYFLSTLIIRLFAINTSLGPVRIAQITSGICFIELILRLQLKVHTSKSDSVTEQVRIFDKMSMEIYGSGFLSDKNKYRQTLKSELEKFGSIKLFDNDLNQITVKEGQRITCHQPTEHKARLFLLGGSTIFNAEVPNSKTIASLLQLKLNSACLRVKVENFGLSGATTANRLNFFKENIFPIAGDMVILFFGVNDAAIKGQFNKNESSLDLVCVMFNNAISLFRRYLLFFKLVPKLKKVGGKIKVEKYIKTISIPSIIDFSEWCKSVGIKFIAILQPSLFSISPMTDAISKELSFLPTSLGSSIETANELFMNSLVERDFFVDARSLFNGASVPVYCDWIHTTETGNDQTSVLFFDEILKRV